MPNYVKYDKGPNKGLVKTCGYDKFVQPNPVPSDVKYGTLPKVAKRDCGWKETDCKNARKNDGGEKWFSYNKGLLNEALNKSELIKITKYFKRLNNFIQGINSSNAAGSRVYNLKWYTGGIHNDMKKMAEKLKKKGFELTFPNHPIFCSASMLDGPGCNAGEWERTSGKKFNANCQKQEAEEAKVAFGRTVKSSKAKILTKPSPGKVGDTTKKFRCASKLTGVKRGEKYNTKKDAESKCGSREKVVEVDAWVTGGRKSRRRRRRRSRKKGRKSRKSRRRNKRKSRKRRSRRKSRKRRRR